jgi:HipA-like C-terminal domain
MSEPFPIRKLRFDSPDVIEQLGSKPKFWFRKADDEQPWLFKFTRAHTGEDWSEKIASEVAKLLRVPAAEVELAEFLGNRGSASRSFVRTKQGFELIHGSEVLAGRVFGYQKSKLRHQSDHCLKNILAAIDGTFPPRERIQQLRTLAGFIVLDGIICNTDRHHDNWGLLRGPKSSGGMAHQVAPSFDHASLLGRELLSERRCRLLSVEDRIERYALKGSGGIYLEETDKKGENPVILAIKAAQRFQNYFRPWLERVREFTIDDLNGIVERVPTELMDIEARQFCLELMSCTVERLKSVQL